MKQNLNKTDHQLLLGLIQGKSLKELSIEMERTIISLSGRMQHIKHCLDCKTMYQAIAIEVINLLDFEEDKINSLVITKSMSAGIGM